MIKREIFSAEKRNLSFSTPRFLNSRLWLCHQHTHTHSRCACVYACACGFGGSIYIHTYICGMIKHMQTHTDTYRCHHWHWEHHYACLSLSLRLHVQIILFLAFTRLHLLSCTYTCHYRHLCVCGYVSFYLYCVSLCVWFEYILFVYIYMHVCVCIYTYLRTCMRMY